MNASRGNYSIMDIGESGGVEIEWQKIHGKKKRDRVESRY